MSRNPVYRPDAFPKEEVVKDKETGLLMGVDALTKEVLWRQKAGKPVPFKESPNIYKVDGYTIEATDKDGNKVLVPYNPIFLKFHEELWPYVEAIALEITRRITEGDSMKKICTTEGMPPLYIVARWKALVPGFNKMLEEARKIRAETYHDEIVEVVEGVEEDNAKSAKVKLDGYKHLAAVGDPDTYGSKTKVSGDSNSPLSFVFNTGIDRKKALEENLPIEVEGKEIDEPSNDS